MRSALLRLGFLGTLALAAAASAAACSATGGDNTFPGEGGGGNGSGDTVGSGKGGDDIGLGGGGPTGSTGSGTPGCDSGPDDDKDQDGFTFAQGDCNDCDPNVNPGALEVIAQPDGNGNTPEAADEDCDGQVDNVVASCDDNVALGDQDPKNGARAIDLCSFPPAGSKAWGVLDARYVRADGSTYAPSTQVGIQTAFGPNVNVQNGKRLLVLSSGNARIPGQPDACGSESCDHNLFGNPPPGFPQDVPNCQGDTEINDDVGLQLKLRAPKNATGYSFNFFFYSFEFPEWVCTSYNDQFIALVQPPPAGSVNGNISFDSKKNPVSVNIAFFDACDPNSKGEFASLCFSGNCPAPPNPYCPGGIGQLQGTGFDFDAGGTGWLKTQAPIKGGDEFTIRFAIWDTGDQALDSSALIDNFQWIANGGTVAIGTDPIETPK